jgi:hypothetical protein
MMRNEVRHERGRTTADGIGDDEGGADRLGVGERREEERKKEKRERKKPTTV